MMMMGMGTGPERADFGNVPTFGDAQGMKKTKSNSAAQRRAEERKEMAQREEEHAIKELDLAGLDLMGWDNNELLSPSSDVSSHTSFEGMDAVGFHAPEAAVDPFTSFGSSAMDARCPPDPLRVHGDGAMDNCVVGASPPEASWFLVPDVCTGGFGGGDESPLSTSPASTTGDGAYSQAIQDGLLEMIRDGVLTNSALLDSPGMYGDSMDVEGSAGHLTTGLPMNEAEQRWYAGFANGFSYSWLDAPCIDQDVSEYTRAGSESPADAAMVHAVRAGMKRRRDSSDSESDTERRSKAARRALFDSPGSPLSAPCSPVSEAGSPSASSDESSDSDAMESSVERAGAIPYCVKRRVSEDKRVVVLHTAEPRTAHTYRSQADMYKAAVSLTMRNALTIHDHPFEKNTLKDLQNCAGMVYVIKNPKKRVPPGEGWRNHKRRWDLGGSVDPAQCGSSQYHVPAHKHDEQRVTCRIYWWTEGDSSFTLYHYYRPRD